MNMRGATKPQNFLKHNISPFTKELPWDQIIICSRQDKLKNFGLPNRVKQFSKVLLFQAPVCVRAPKRENYDSKQND